MADEADHEKQLLDQLSHHLIGVFCQHAPTGVDDTLAEGYITASAFVIEIRGVWFLATAGHFIEDVEKFRKAHPTRKVSFWMADSISPHAQSTMFVPLIFDDAKKHYIYREEDGIDFGLIALYSNTCDLLEVNGIVPVYEWHWKDWSSLTFNDFKMIGVPFELLENKPNAVTIHAVMLTLRRLPEPPETLRRHVHPMFYAEIEGLGDISSIVGMSGCPIVGLAWNDGQLSYYFLAIQSGWLPVRQIIYGCDLPYLANLLLSALDEMSETGQASS